MGAQTQTKGFCKYCGKEYTRSGMLRHLGACKERKNKLAMETGKRKCKYLRYDSCPVTDIFWGEPSKNMNYRLRDVVAVGDSISYEYDFGSTTELMLSIHSCREGEKKNSGIIILSRNNPPKIFCSNCERNEAKWVAPEGYYGGVHFWCAECLDAENDDDEEECYEPEFLLPVCNSPRMGECGYEGSDSYPDQFEPDKQ